jgi:uncharacterized membrane protein YbhN (UPF0104 family)
LWEQVAALHRARITHGALDPDHVVQTESGPAFVGFGRASTAAFDERHIRDIAELLTTTAAVAGDERAVATCVAVLGRPALAATLPFLQPAALGRVTRSASGGHRREVEQRLDSLCQASAVAAGVEAPALQKLQRFKTTSLLLAASSLVAVAALLNQVGSPSNVWETVNQAHWEWAALALGLSLVTNIPFAIALMGTLPLRLPLWPTSELELAMSYSNLVIPVIGGTGFQIRFLQRHGADLPAAVAAGGLLATAGTVIAQVPLFALAVWLSPDSFNLGGISVSGLVQGTVLAVLAVGVIAAALLGVPRLRKAVLPPLREGATTIWAAVRSRRQLGLLLGGNVVVAILYAACLLCCLLAFDGSLSLWTLLALTIGVGTLAALVPIPGGGTAVGSVGMAGALAAFGVPTHVAVATVLANQLAVNYLPAVPGWFATRHLLQRRYL